MVLSWDQGIRTEHAKGRTHAKAASGAAGGYGAAKFGAGRARPVWGLGKKFCLLWAELQMLTLKAWPVDLVKGFWDVMRGTISDERDRT